MNILYISSMFDYETYNELFTKTVKPMHAANKYHTLLCKGLVQNGGLVNSLSALPVNRSNCDKKYVKVKKKVVNGYMQKYPAFFNFPILRHVKLFFSAFFKSLFSTKNTLVIYDTLIVAMSYGAVLGAKLSGKKSIAIITDLPVFLNKSKKRFILKIKNKLMHMANGYIFLTEQMHEAVNKKNKPYIVVEGLVDQEISAQEHKPFRECEKSVLYAGSLQKIYGIKNLCESFVRCAKKEEKLHIYGDGDYLPELKELLKSHENIIYHGNRPNQEVVDAELETTLLVNPRPCEGEYTKYSFPSKTLEYMVSGTPLLTAHLAGIPKEYDRYLYYFDDLSDDGLESKIREILDKDALELEQFGANARAFVLSEKNNVLQAKRVVEFLRKFQKEG